MISAKEYAQRRQRLMRSMGKGSIAIIAATPEYIRNGDNHYPYRQHSDFYYLTGFTEPEAIAVFIATGRRGQYILFNRPRDKAAEIWNGPRVGQKTAVKRFGADAAYPIEDFILYLPKLLQDKQRLYYTLGSDLELDTIIIDELNILRSKGRKSVVIPTEIIDLRTLVHEMRLVKSAGEIKLMRKAAKLSAQAHKRAMQACCPEMYEYELEAEITHECVRNGSRAFAYESIVGSGANACILHYRNNNTIMKNKDLVLIDAGCEYYGYASDITRTFPVNGKFTNEQRLIYEIVLQAQLAAIAQVKPGNPWDKPQQVIIEIITKGLLKLGILQGDYKQLLAKQAYLPFYMHGSGHWLGLDVHDVGDYKQNGQWRKFKPGMVLTVEPGIYIAAHSKGVAKKWWNIGVRIEDDVLVTQRGCEILSSGVPKTVGEIEQLMAVKREG